MPESSLGGTRLGLDARAAELKEKLVRGLRSQSLSNNASNPPSDAESQTREASPREEAKIPGLSIITTTTRRTPKTSPSEFVPHPIPQMPQQTSVPASANDIAALIDSISSNIRDKGKQDDTNAPARASVNPPNSTAQPANSESHWQSQKTSSPAKTSDDLTREQVSANKYASPREEGEVISGDKASEAPSAHQRVPSSHCQDSTQRPEPTKVMKPENSGGNHQIDQRTNRNNRVKQATKVANPTPPKEALANLLERDPDLRDWLLVTDYYNVEARTRKLERYRRAKILAAEKERIEEEQRKLMEEEELDMGIHRSVPAPASTDTPVLTPVSGSNSSVNIPSAASKMTDEPPVLPQVVPAKRGYTLDSDNPEPAPKLQRLDQESDKPVKSDNKLGRPPPSRPASPRRNSRHSIENYPYSPPPFRRSPPHRREFSEIERLPQGPRSRVERHEFEGTPRYDSYKGDGARREPSPRRGDRFSPSIKDLDLGHKGDTRFFIVKSFNEDNVRKCMQDGVWATQTKNGQVLTSAFANCKNVIFFYSINKSRAFQGVARMETAPSPDTPRPKWMNGIHWDTSPPFRVEWLSKVPVEFARVGHLKNRYNEDHPVLVGKDGQEIEEDCARQLLRIMEGVADGTGDWMSPRGGKKIFYPSPRRGFERGFSREGDGMRIKGFAGVKKEDQGW